MFTMAPRRVWEHNWFVMAHSQVYLHRCDGQLWLCLFYAASVSVLLLLPMSQCACVSVCLYLLLTMDLCVGMAVCLSVVFGCDCRGTMDVYFQKYFLWMKTKTWVCVLVDQIAGSYKRWMNADSLTDTTSADVSSCHFIILTWLIVIFPSCHWTGLIWLTLVTFFIIFIRLLFSFSSLAA